jgi:hypothetical protein
MAGLKSRPPHICNVRQFFPMEGGTLVPPQTAGRRPSTVDPPSQYGNRSFNFKMGASNTRQEIHAIANAGIVAAT